jgi:hypothetical protein
LAASGFAAASIGGGLLTGIAGSLASSPILGIGNSSDFGDQYSYASLGKDALLGGLTGGILKDSLHRVAQIFGRD